MNKISSIDCDRLANTAVVILNWNRATDTIECLDSLLPVVAAGLGTVVCCDNASSDDSVAVLEAWGRRHFPCSIGDAMAVALQSPIKSSEFVLLQTERNGGYAAGNNVALRYLLAQGCYQFIWLLNNDTVVEADALPKLLDYASRHPQAGAIGSTLVDYHQRRWVQCAGGCRYLPAFTIMWNVLGGHPLEDVLQRERVYLDYVHGAAVLLTTSAIAEVGLLNEQFFLYYEEADYARRLRSKGYDLAWCHDSVVYHKGAVSTGGRSTAKQRESILANYHENLSTLLFTYLHYPYLLPLAASFRLAMKILVFLLFQRSYLFRPLLRAYCDFMQLRHREIASLMSDIIFRGTYS